MKEKSFNIGETLKEGWKHFTRHWIFLISFQIALLLIYLVYQSLPFSMMMKKPEQMNAWYALFIFTSLGLSVLIFLITLIATMGFYQSIIMITDGAKPTFNQLYKNWRLSISWFIAHITYTFVWSLCLTLFIIPGLYFLARYGLFPFVLLDRKLEPFKALGETADITKNHRWKIFWLSTLCIIINLAGTLIFLVGLLVTLPVTLLAMATAYRKLSNVDSLTSSVQ